MQSVRVATMSKFCQCPSQQNSWKSQSSYLRLTSRRNHNVFWADLSTTHFPLCNTCARFHPTLGFPDLPLQYLILLKRIGAFYKCLLWKSWASQMLSSSAPIVILRFFISVTVFSGGRRCRIQHLAVDENVWKKIARMWVCRKLVYDRCLYWPCFS